MGKETYLAQLRESLSKLDEREDALIERRKALKARYRAKRIPRQVYKRQMAEIELKVAKINHCRELINRLGKRPTAEPRPGCLGMLLVLLIG